MNVLNLRCRKDRTSGSPNVTLVSHHVKRVQENGYTHMGRKTDMSESHIWFLEQEINTQARQMAPIVIPLNQEPVILFPSPCHYFENCICALFLPHIFTLRLPTVRFKCSRCSRCTESVAGFVLPGADVEARQEDGVVVVPVFPASQGGLPVAEAVQCVVGVVVDHQPLLGDKADKSGADGETRGPSLWLTCTNAYLTCKQDHYYIYTDICKYM